MAELIGNIRNTPRAVIIKDDQLLLIRKFCELRGERFALPGGAQDLGESLIDALKRECLEEINTNVSVGALLHVADCLKLKDSQPPTRRHLLEYFFLCSVPDDYVPSSGHHPDKHQTGVDWISLTEIAHTPLLPRYHKRVLFRQQAQQPDFYLGQFDDSSH